MIHRAWKRWRGRVWNRRQWEQLWSDPQYDPRWLRRGIFPEIQEAEASGWFAPGMPALDAGCGEGEVAAWLAQQGHPTIGVDIAEAVVLRARRLHGERQGKLRFVRADLCRGVPAGGPFHVVVDCGCFHQLLGDEPKVYGRQLAKACAADARLLIFARAFRDGIPYGDSREMQRKGAEVDAAFGADFEIERVAPTYLDRCRGEDPEMQLPGIVFWLRRRPC